MAKLDSVLRHAITPPAFEPSKIHRERLVDAIHANIPRKLIVVAAPAGYGKTTLLADFTSHTDLPVCWVRLTEADTDVIRFATVLASSLQRRFRRLQDHLDLSRHSGSSPEAIARAFIEVIDARVSETFVIALDDVHLINHSKPTITFIDALLEELPDQATLIAAGREVLEVSLARLMAESDLVGLGPQDLALSKSEIIALARMQSGITISDDDAEHLQEETRGWITGVLLSTELSGGGLGTVLADARPMVYEYLASVVLNRQPDDLRRFILDTSVFPVMTAEGCDHILKRNDSARFLSRLVRAGLFVTATDEVSRTFEYHPQFREFLLETLLNADRNRYKRLLVGAADYLAEHELPEHAVDLYCDAGAYPRAARLADRWAQDLYRDGRWQTLEAWSRRLEEVESSAPRVFLYLAAQYINQGNVEQAISSLESARNMFNTRTAKAVRAYAEIIEGHIAFRQRKFEAVLEAADKAERILAPSGSRHRKADCHRLRAITFASRGDFSSAEFHASKAVSLLEQTDLKFALAIGLVDFSNVQTALGKSQEGHATALRAHEIFKDIGAPLILASSYNNLAYDAHLQGRYQEALDLFNEGLKFARRAASPATEIAILFGQADLFADMDLALQAAELYGQGLNIAIRLDDVAFISYGCVQTSVLHRRRGGSGLAHEWLKRAMTLEDTDPLPSNIVIQLATLESAAKPQQAQESITSLLNKSETLDANERTLGFYSLARAALLAGDLETSQQTLEQALDWAGGNGCEQILAGELAFDSDFRDFARLKLGGHPILSIILRRIETMRAIAQQYQEITGEVETEAKIIFTALGDAAIQHSGIYLSDLKPLAREVLFFLVDHQRVDRDVLLETFWTHHPPGRQVANLHTAVYSLRRALGKDAIQHGGTLYEINPDVLLEYDVLRFERAASIADGLPPGDPRRMFALTEAINSYGGSFLPEYTSDWVLERRRDLEIRYLDLLAQHAEEALVRDQPLRAVNTLRQALQIDPYRDDTNMHFLEALGRLGRRSEIVTHYQRYVRLLADELGLDPPKQVRELYARLIN